jgi:hypothetical protein
MPSQRGPLGAGIGGGSEQFARQRLVLGEKWPMGAQKAARATLQLSKFRKSSDNELGSFYRQIQSTPAAFSPDDLGRLFTFLRFLFFFLFLAVVQTIVGRPVAPQSAQHEFGCRLGSQLFDQPRLAVLSTKILFLGGWVGKRNGKSKWKEPNGRGCQSSECAANGQGLSGKMDLSRPECSHSVG